MPYCSNCGEEVEEDDSYCPECGEDLSGQDSDETSEQEKESYFINTSIPSKKLLVAGGLITVLAFFAINFVSNSAITQPNSPPENAFSLESYQWTELNSPRDSQGVVELTLRAKDGFSKTFDVSYASGETGGEVTTREEFVDSGEEINIEVLAQYGGNPDINYGYGNALNNARQEFNIDSPPEPGLEIASEQPLRVDVRDEERIGGQDAYMADWARPTIRLRNPSNMEITMKIISDKNNDPWTQLNWIESTNNYTSENIHIQPKSVETINPHLYIQGDVQDGETVSVPLTYYYYGRTNTLNLDVEVNKIGR